MISNLFNSLVYKCPVFTFTNVFVNVSRSFLEENIFLDQHQYCSKRNFTDFGIRNVRLDFDTINLTKFDAKTPLRKWYTNLLRNLYKYFLNLRNLFYTCTL